MTFLELQILQERVVWYFDSPGVRDEESTIYNPNWDPLAEWKLNNPPEKE